jgi:hypothetical protein
MTEIKNIRTTFYNSGIWRDMFQPTDVPVMSGVVSVFSSSVAVLTVIGSICVMPLLQSVSDISYSYMVLALR